jgi:hypothetical protein
MVGYMVTTHEGGHRNFYMVDHVRPEKACEMVDKAMPTRGGARALTMLSDDTLEHHDVRPNSFWLCCTMRDDGHVTASGFEPDGRSKKKIRR